MPDHDDFLDHTGRTPREFGAIHIYVEPVVRGPSGDAVANVWLQSAFEPLLSTDVLHIVARLADDKELSLKSLPLPALAGGKVVRWSMPLSLPPDLAELQFRVESKLHPKAERVRPAWKLFDTLEIPKESEMSPPPASIELNLARSVVGSVLLGGPVIAFSVGTSVSTQARTKVHAARALPLGFVAQVVEGSPEPLDGPRVEGVWAPGQPLPAAVGAPVPVAPKQEEAKRPPRGAMRTCYSCGFEGALSEYERALICPRCDTGWL